MPLPRWPTWDEIETGWYDLPTVEQLGLLQEEDTNKEVNYVFLKGQGWVPETSNVKSLIAKQKAEEEAKERKRQEEEFARRFDQHQRRYYTRGVNFGYPGGMGATGMQQIPRRWANEYRAYAEEYGEALHREREARAQREREEARVLREQMIADADRYWADMTLPFTITTTTTVNTNTTEPDTWYTVRDNYGAGIRGHGDTPRQPTGEEPNTTRYYPGAGVRAEPVRAENPAERRVREWQEARARWRRR